MCVDFAVGKPNVTDTERICILMFIYNAYMSIHFYFYAKYVHLEVTLPILTILSNCSLVIGPLGSLLSRH